MSGRDFQWITLAAEFPAGLDTETPPTLLKDGYTPDGYGFDIDYPGRLVHTGSNIDVGTQYTNKTVTVGADNWKWFLRRLWRVNGGNLEYNAPEYRDVVLYQDIGKLEFHEPTTTTLIGFFPIGGDMFVFNNSGGWIVPNAISLDGDFQHGNIEEAMSAAAANNATPLDGKAYVSRGAGLYAWNGGEVEEVSKNIRSAVSDYVGAKTLYLNQAKRRIIGSTGGVTTTFVYDKGMDKFFVYKSSNTTFRYTTRTLTDAKYNPFAVRKVQFIYDNVGGGRGELAVQKKLDDGDWTSDDTLRIQAVEGKYKRATMDFERSPMSREFTMRLTALSSHIHIRRISVGVIADTFEETPSV